MLNNIPDTSESAPKICCPLILGFDPGRQKCGLAILGVDHSIYWHDVVLTHKVIETINKLREIYPVSLLVIGNQTSSQDWLQKLENVLFPSLPITEIDERYSTLKARDRYWQMFPPQGFSRLVPQKLRTIDRPIDDIVAIILIERYLEQLESKT